MGYVKQLTDTWKDYQKSVGEVIKYIMDKTEGIPVIGQPYNVFVDYYWMTEASFEKVDVVSIINIAAPRFEDNDTELIIQYKVLTEQDGSSGNESRMFVEIDITKEEPKIIKTRLQ